MQKLTFQIIHCSGEDPNHPISTLLNPNPQGQGWITSRFCDYPQEIIFDFFKPVRIRHIQILCHESKISSKLELYISLPSINNRPSNSSQIKFQKLGFVIFDNNERSAYQARELKSIHIDAPCIYLKIVLHKHYQNKYNLFNQIGLILVNFYGEPFSINITEKIIDKKNENMIENNIPNNSPFNQAIMDRLKELEKLKQNAIKIEDFDKAKYLKAEIDRIYAIGEQIQKLEDRKNRCVQNDDYASAKIIKSEIDHLKSLLYNTNEEIHPKQHPQQIQNNNNNPDNAIPSIVVEKDKEKDKDKEKEIIDNIYEEDNHGDNQKPAVFKDDIKEEMEKSNSKFFQTENDLGSKSNTNHNVGSMNIKEKYYNHDNQVIPTLRHRSVSPKIEEGESAIEGESSQQTPENLNEDTRKLAEPLIPFLGEELCKKIFSKNWTLKENALQIIKDELQNPKSTILNNTDPTALYLAILSIIRVTIGNHIHHVSYNAMSLLNIILQRLKQLPTTKNDFQYNINSIINSLLEKIGDQHSRMRGYAIGCFMDLARNPLVTCNHIVLIIIKPFKFTKNKTNNSLRHMVSKMTILKQIIQEYKIGNNDVPLNPVIEFLEEKLDHPTIEIRTLAVETLGDIYRIIGDKIRTVLKVGGVHMEMLEKEFKNPGQGLKTSPKLKNNSQKAKEVPLNNNMMQNDLFTNSHNNNNQQQKITMQPSTSTNQVIQQKNLPVNNQQQQLPQNKNQAPVNNPNQQAQKITVETIIQQNANANNKNAASKKGSEKLKK